MKKTPGLLTVACGLAISQLSVFLVHAQFTGTVTITDYTGPGGAVTIPESIGDLPVTAIGDEAFAGNPAITSVVIPSSVLTIGRGAFQSCRSLTNVTMNSSLATIADYAFSGCSSLTNITIPNGVTTIGYSAFQGCTSLTTITIPSSVMSMAFPAFESSGVTAINVDALNPNYSSWEGVLFNKTRTTLVEFPPGRIGPYTVPDGVTNIAYGAFRNCTNLTSVTTGNSVISIERWTFYGCTGLTNVSIGDGVNSIGDWAFHRCTNLSQVTIGNNVARIGNEAFANCLKLTAITIPDSVTQIGDGAFSYCSFTNINIPANVTNLGVMAFQSRTLSAFTVAPLNPVYSDLDGILFNKAQTSLIQCPAAQSGSYLVPFGVTNIGLGAFSQCTELGEVTIPDSVTTIGDSAFSSCASLTNLTIPASVTSIGDYAFGGCRRLTSIAIPDGVLSLGTGAFQSCEALETITVPNSVTNIGDGAFADCDSLFSIDVESLNSYYSSWEGVLYNKDQTVLILCPSGKTGSYTVPGSVTNIGERAFAACNLSEVTLGKNVNSIGDEAFEVARLTAIDVDPLNSFYSSIAGVLFNQNHTTLIQYPAGRVGSYAVPEGVTSIGNAAFAHCLSLTGVAIADSVLSIGDSAFENCWFLADVAIGRHVGRIGNSAFAVCGDLASATIPSSVTSMGTGAFSFCHSLTGLYFEGNAPVIDTRQSYYDTGDQWTAFYLPGTSGWGTTFDNRPTAPWVLPYPVILANNGSCGVQNSTFGFTISWATNLTVVVEACTDLQNPIWTPVQTLALTNGSAYFSDSEWINHPARFYQVKAL